ncbi:HlyC/CorC family transporter [Neglecta sp. X4]|uniref:HlyC/CorC family transporter n=1 Tax=unclassified Neglectibacter TaxID=2632164 RepID=UPI00136EDA2E|nr:MULTISPECIES: hemolysin family protein [unclassified Neglectibacter]NBI16147.1 HlyC/CorC family transporter [Neglectibacter sp. 59]NBJ71844.1 HlyC/CorC family transporter [Neglectibacter sp. X4]NCE79621.1 HlyC/CorC family transporter [Neglectibacter sp. X58]
MDSHSTTMILVLVCLVFLSAYFSATETAFSSLNRIRLKNMASGGNRRAQTALSLSENYDELLSTILVGNNIVNIASASIATTLFVAALGGSAGPTVSTVVMTVVVLIFGEVSPKSLAKENAESFAMFSAPLLRVLVVVLKPVNFLFTQLKKGLHKIFRVKADYSMTDSELLTIVEEAEQGGGIDEDEGAMLRNVIEFDDIEAIDIMTPRVDVEAVSFDAKKNDVAALFRSTGFSRLPVYKETIDSIIGVIHEKDFYSFVWDTQQEIDSIIKPAEFIPPSMKVSALLKSLQQSKSHIAVIIDEFGGTEGIVTLEDVLEELVGEIWDEHDRVVQQGFQKVKEGEYRVFCSADLDDLFEFFHISCETEASTINGWILENLDRIPAEGDVFAYQGLTFTVARVENNRTEEVLVRCPADAEKQAEG